MKVAYCQYCLHDATMVAQMIVEILFLLWLQCVISK
jgi:hypothetical protein